MPMLLCMEFFMTAKFREFTWAILNDDYRHIWDATSGRSSKAISYIAELFEPFRSCELMQSLTSAVQSIGERMIILWILVRSVTSKSIIYWFHRGRRVCSRRTSM